MPVFRMLRALSVALLALFAVGCAEERDPINRVQPYALKKSFFIGEKFNDPKDDPEFWSQASLVDVGYGASQDGLFTSTYAQPMSRIKWQVTEDLLIGRLAYERIPGSDGKGVGKATQDGVIVAAFPIRSHFDIQRDYNPTTGEELNVLGENSFDRPWYERQYMRVDWSRNLNTDSYDFDTLSMLGVYGGITYEPMAYDIVDPNDENAPYFAKDGSYFDVTSKAFARPGTIDLSHLGWGIGSFPACFLDADFAGGTAPSGTCNPVELTIRHSFRRVVDTDYEPQQWDGFRFQSFGAFYGERSGYARNYGMTDELWYRMIERYNVWQRSHYYKDPANMTGEVKCFVPAKECADGSCVGTPVGADPHRDTDGDGTEDECAAVTTALGVGGSRCDTFKQKCTLPYTQRASRPVTWYYTSGSNPEYFGPTEEATHEWDVALRAAVTTARYGECKRVNGLDGDCSQFPVFDGQYEDQQDLIWLAKEVDDCRHGISRPELGRNEAACTALADTLGAEREIKGAVIALAKQPEMVVLCHSPVEAGDPAICTPNGEPRLPANISSQACYQARQDGNLALMATCKEALTIRRGDLRYHHVNSMVEPQTPSPWGIMVDAHDPLTGEDISASINIWTHVNDLWSQGIVDQARYIAGELKTEDITEGTYIRDWSKAAQAASGSGMAPLLSREELDDQVGRMYEQSTKLRGEAKERAVEIKPEAIELARNLKTKLKSVVASLDAPSATAPMVMARRQSAVGTPFEAALMTPMVQQMHGIAGMPLSQGLMEMVSPLRGANPSVMRQIRLMREQALSARGACIMQQAEAPMALAALSDVLQAKFGAFNPADSKDAQQERAEKMRAYMARRAQYAVIIHEMGHSIGLRHNFVSSSNAFNYRPQYWQLRTKNGAVTQECTNLAQNGETCVGPRWFDPVTQEERDNLIWMFMHSSVMEYAGEATQDFLGLGTYDFGAARMFYGDTVAVHADDDMKSNRNLGKGSLAATDNFGGILGISFTTNGQTDMHYSQLNARYKLINDCKQIDAQQWKPARWNTEKDGEWSPLLDGLLVQVDGSYTRCRQRAVDYVQWDALRQPTASEAAQYRGGPAVDGKGRTRVPYGFATDRWADLGNVSVYRHDNGADNYEIFNFLITQQEVGHIFDNYRRGRKSFSVRGAAGRTLGRFNEKMRDGAKGLGLFRNIYRDLALEIGVNPEDMWTYAASNFFPDSVLAAGMAFDHFVRTATRPQAGPHFIQDGVLRSADGRLSAGGGSATDVTIPNGATGYFGNVTFGGRLVNNTLSDNQGEYDSEYTLNAGSYYDKMYVAMLMTESFDNFISSTLGDFTDSRYRAVSLADLFPEGYRRFLSNALTGDDELKGARIVTNASGKPVTEDNQGGFPTQGIGWVSWWGNEPAHCFPGNGTTICRRYGADSQNPFGATKPTDSMAIDPQIGWEQQKFLIAWTMLYLFENKQQNWLDQLRVWELGVDADPEFQQRIEFHYPNGKTYVARSFGKEVLFGKLVEKGISGRVLEYANQLMVEAYETTDGPDVDGDGKPDWYLPKLDATGKVRVKYDSTLGGVVAGPAPATCNDTNNSGCICESNRACMKLKQYVEVPFYLREAVSAYRIGGPSAKGIY